MTSSKDRYISAFHGFTVLKLPYKQGQDTREFSMYIFLPDEIHDLSSLVEKVCSKPGFLEHHLPCSHVKVGDFQIPRFKILFKFMTWQMELGLVPPLSPSATDLTGMVEGGGIFVGELFHKSFIEVKEEGTEAAAVTIALMYGCASGNARMVMVIDFVAAIHSCS